MNKFYEWLYDHYAAPHISDEDFFPIYQEQKRQWQEVVDRLPRHERLLVRDFFDTLRSCWGAESFAWGVMAGLQLARAPSAPEDE